MWWERASISSFPNFSRPGRGKLWQAEAKPAKPCPNLLFEDSLQVFTGMFQGMIPLQLPRLLDLTRQMSLGVPWSCDMQRCVSFWGNGLGKIMKPRCEPRRVVRRRKTGWIFIRYHRHLLEMYTKEFRLSRPGFLNTEERPWIHRIRRLVTVG